MCIASHELPREIASRVRNCKGEPRHKRKGARENKNKKKAHFLLMWRLSLWLFGRKSLLKNNALNTFFIANLMLLMEHHSLKQIKAARILIIP